MVDDRGSDRRDRTDERLGRLALLGEPIRRALYRYVASRPSAVTREQAAEAVGVPQHTAKFHLDRLESGGLLDAAYERRGERSGPGAGRPAKVYTRSGTELAVSLPARRYEVLSSVMAEAVEAAADSGIDLSGALQRAATRAGREAGAAADGIEDALAEVGYEPREEEGAYVLVNCPFHHLAQSHTDLVCTMNEAFVRGLLEGTRTGSLTPRLDPCEGRCCVVLDPREGTPADSA